MSLLIQQEVPCTNCKHPNQAEVWSAINVKDDPELKDLLLGGEINMIDCEGCGEVFYAENFLLYHDPSSELMAFVYPVAHAAERSKWEEKTAADFSVLQQDAEGEKKINYGPLSLFGLDELVSIVEWDDEVNIQGEIVAVLADEHKFPIQRIAPALARRQKLPVVLPLGLSSSPMRQRIIEGLDHLQAINDRLFVYTQLRGRLINDAEFQPVLA